MLIVKNKAALGKGLTALFEDNDIQFEDNNVQIKNKQVITLKINDIEPNKGQPRSYFDKEKLEELADSIAEHGVLQPIIVREIAEGRYQIISGERRWRASRMAGLNEVPIIIRDLDEQAILEVALIENLQREDLNVIEEAKGYKELMTNFSMTQETVAKRVGKSRPVIANALRLLALPEEVLSLVEGGELSPGHARALLPLLEKMNKDAFLELTNNVIIKNMTVRDLENLDKSLNNGKTEKKKKQKDIYISEIENDISRVWGRKIKISSTRNKGKIELEFYNKEDFENLISALKKK